MKKIFYIMIIFLFGCANKYEIISTKKPQPKVYDIKPIKVMDINDVNLGISDQGTPIDKPSEFLAPISVQEPDIRNKNFEQNFDLKVIYFDFDSYDIKDEYVDQIKQNVAWLNKNLQYYVLLEGHTDQQGTNEYNLALAQQRATSARAYLAYLGIDPKRIATISYGEEKLAVNDNTEEAYKLNRRVEFLLFKDEMKNQNE